MADDLRTCRRTACRWPAAASLSYRYATRQVWLLDLENEPDPSRYDLCPHHADNLTVPRGWDRVDQRTTRPVVHEPAGRDLVAPAPARPSGDDRVRAMVGAGAPARPDAGQPQASRYAALAQDLPRLAAQWGADPHSYDHAAIDHAAIDLTAVEDLTAEEGLTAVEDLTAAEDPGADEPAPRPPAAQPVPSRDLAPMPPPTGAPPDASAPPATAPPSAEQFDGQLAMLRDEPDAVVVSIELAGRRRPDA